MKQKRNRVSDTAARYEFVSDVALLRLIYYLRKGMNAPQSLQRNISLLKQENLLEPQVLREWVC
ncbi:MAG: hypothetical protein KI793_24505 [Rivularia sp. (in: Bacteria)]|nr:hypothetical protein [Rivularia sp. MS3]